MAVLVRPFRAAFLAASLLAVAPFEAAMAQGGPVVGAPGGASQTAPSNSEGFRAGGTGVIGSTQVAPSTGTVRPAPRRPRRQQVRRARPRPRPVATAPAATAPVPGDAAPAAPLSGTVPTPR